MDSLIDLVKSYVDNGTITTNANSIVIKNASTDIITGTAASTPLAWIVDCMNINKVSLQDMIVLLDIYLTSENDKERNKATYLLADLLHYGGDDTNHNNAIIRESLSLIIIIIVKVTIIKTIIKS